MSYSARDREKARRLFVEQGMSDRAIHAETGIGRATIASWRVAEGWEQLRELECTVRLKSRQLFVAMIDAARESNDPQQTYAAVQAAKMAGVDLAPKDEPPDVEPIVRALVDVLATHPEVGPIVRRHKSDVIRLVVARAEKFGEASS